MYQRKTPTNSGSLWRAVGFCLVESPPLLLSALLKSVERMFVRPSSKRRARNDHGTFNPEDTNQVKHTRVGVWDLYRQKHSRVIQVPGFGGLERRLQILNDLPFVWRMLKDIVSIKSCWIYLLLYVVIEALNALVPAVNLWYVAVVACHILT